MKPYLLFHWSPVSRRTSIATRGLVPGKHHPPVFRPTAKYIGGGKSLPWTCFATSPSVAWAMSATHGKPNKDWDLWMVWSHHIPKGQILRRRISDIPYDKEHRVLCPIPAGNLWRVGSRRFRGRRFK